MPFNSGDSIPDQGEIIRRIHKQHVLGDQIHFEAFAPREKDRVLEAGVSVDVRANLTEPIGNDRWHNPSRARDPKWASGVLEAKVPNTLNYPVVKTNGPSHCEISGNMQQLVDDEASLRKMARATTYVHNPFS